MTMTSSNASLADWLYQWLRDRPSDVLPRLNDIASQRGRGCDAWMIHGALTLLRNHHKIEWRCGTRSQHRGQQFVRIIATGRVLKTDGCPPEWANPELARIPLRDLSEAQADAKA